MTSTRPYLLRAIYEWIVDNGLTPHLLVQVVDDQVMVPRQFVEKGAIVLNVSPSAVRDLSLGNDAVDFNARFGGQPQHVHVPVGAIQAIYARENGQGIFLGETEVTGAEGDDASADAGSASGTEGAGPRRPPHLTIVK
ncbi:MAG: ClpXP protease specificity-enhancing factor [Gammaproteobacteria bacterium]